MIRLVCAWCFLLFATATCGAPFQNGSFELGPPNPCDTFNISVNDTRITGWTVSVGNIDWESAPPCGWQPSNGSNSLDLVGTGGIGGITQTFDTVPGRTYQVQFDLAGNYGRPPIIKPLAVTINGTTTNFTFDTTGKGQLNMGWTTHTIVFTAASASSTINFVSDVTPSGGTLDAGAALDNVSIFPLATDLPLGWAHWAAAALLALCGVALLWRRGGGPVAR
jgi:choice-of-anchor C domain-containing protein